MSARTSYYIYITSYISIFYLQLTITHIIIHLLIYSHLTITYSLTHHSALIIHYLLLSIYSHILNYIHNCSSALPEKKERGRGRGKTKKGERQYQS